MSDHDAKPIGILRWLGLGGAPHPEETDEAQTHDAASEPSEAEDPRERRRKQLIADIGSFLGTHRLEVNPFTLAVAHDVITGADAKLSSLVQERVISRQPVTLHWLEDACHTSGRNDGVAQLDALMVKLEHSIQDFGKTTFTANFAITLANAGNKTLLIDADLRRQLTRSKALQMLLWSFIKLVDGKGE